MVSMKSSRTSLVSNKMREESTKSVKIDPKIENDENAKNRGNSQTSFKGQKRSPTPASKSNIDTLNEPGTMEKELSNTSAQNNDTEANEETTRRTRNFSLAGDSRRIKNFFRRKSSKSKKTELREEQNEEKHIPNAEKINDTIESSTVIKEGQQEETCSNVIETNTFPDISKKNQKEEKPSLTKKSSENLRKMKSKKESGHPTRKQRENKRLEKQPSNKDAHSSSSKKEDAFDKTKQNSRKSLESSVRKMDKKKGSHKQIIVAFKSQTIVPKEEVETNCDQRDDFDKDTFVSERVIHIHTDANANTRESSVESSNWVLEPDEFSVEISVNGHSKRPCKKSPKYWGGENYIDNMHSLSTVQTCVGRHDRDMSSITNPPLHDPIESPYPKYFTDRAGASETFTTMTTKSFNSNRSDNATRKNHHVRNKGEEDISYESDYATTAGTNTSISTRSSSVSGNKKKEFVMVYGHEEEENENTTCESVYATTSGTSTSITTKSSSTNSNSRKGNELVVIYENGVREHTRCESENATTAATSSSFTTKSSSVNVNKCSKENSRIVLFRDPDQEVDEDDMSVAITIQDEKNVELEIVRSTSTASRWIKNKKSNRNVKTTIANSSSSSSSSNNYLNAQTPTAEDGSLSFTSFLKQWNDDDKATTENSPQIQENDSEVTVSTVATTNININMQKRPNTSFKTHSKSKSINGSNRSMATQARSNQSPNNTYEDGGQSVVQMQVQQPSMSMESSSNKSCRSKRNSSARRSCTPRNTCTSTHTHTHTHTQLGTISEDASYRHRHSSNATESMENGMKENQASFLSSPSKDSSYYTDCSCSKCAEEIQNVQKKQSDINVVSNTSEDAPSDIALNQDVTVSHPLLLLPYPATKTNGNLNSTSIESIEGSYGTGMLIHNPSPRSANQDTVISSLSGTATATARFDHAPSFCSCRTGASRGVPSISGSCFACDCSECRSQSVDFDIFSYIASPKNMNTNMNMNTNTNMNMNANANTNIKAKTSNYQDDDRTTTTTTAQQQNIKQSSSSRSVGGRQMLNNHKSPSNRKCKDGEDDCPSVASSVHPPTGMFQIKEEDGHHHDSHSHSHLDSDSVQQNDRKQPMAECSCCRKHVVKDEPEPKKLPSFPNLLGSPSNLTTATSTSNSYWPLSERWTPFSMKVTATESYFTSFSDTTTKTKTGTTATAGAKSTFEYRK